MFEFPPEFDVDVFVGSTLELISFNATQVHFYFDSGRISVCTYSPFKRTTDAHVEVVRMPVLQSDLMVLIEHSVTEAATEDGQFLILTFDNGQVLRFETVGGYESYEVVVDGKLTMI